MISRTCRQLGQAAEDIAADFLRRQGLEILSRNFRRRLGELDLIARAGDALVVIEVRTRSSDAYGGAAASIGGRKRRRIIRATLQLLQQDKELARMRVRFDAVVVHDVDAESPRIEWIQHAFTA